VATDPNFTYTPKVWGAQLSATADGTPASATPTGGVVTPVTGGASGSKVEEIALTTFETALDPGVVNVWLHDGSNYFLYDQFKLLGTDGSTTAPGERFNRQYPNLLIPNGWTLKVSSTVASQVGWVVCLGGDF
jgi:hypothetical protein